MQMVRELENQEHSSMPESIKTLIQQFQGVFEEPRSLPPARAMDHQILIEPWAKPVSVRPYRYPQFQKTEIERLVGEMLATDVIRDSRSPFSFPILLVKKNIKVGDYVWIIGN